MRRTIESGGRPGVVFTPPELARRVAAGLEGPLLDPACGEGALLEAALERAGGDGAWAARSLFGIERDPHLLTRARQRLLRRAGAGADSELARALEDHLRPADALDPETPWPAGTSVLANPPWESYSGRHATPLEPERRERYRRRWSSFRSWPSSHGAFAERIAEHLGEHGTRGRLLLPAGLCDQERYGPTREAVTRHARLVGRPHELPPDAFPGIEQPAVWLELEGRGRPQPSPAGWLPASGPEARLLDALAGYPRPARGAFADPGVHTGNAAGELLVELGTPAADPVREGRDLKPYRLSPPRRAVRTDLEPGPERRFRLGARERLEAFPILLRQTADRPIAALHVEPARFRNSLLACRGVEGLDPAFVVAVLNGPVAAAWHRLSFRDARQRVFPQVKVYQLATQPFPIARREEDPHLHDRVVRRVREMAAGADHRRGGEWLAKETAEAFGAETERMATDFSTSRQ